MNSNLKNRTVSSPRDKVYLDILRVAAIFFVFYIHTGVNGELYFTRVQGTPLYIVHLLLASLSRTAIPTFFMVSGALLLNREESTAELFRNRIFRFSLILLLISAVYYLRAVIKSGGNISIVYFFMQLYSVAISPSLWFLYSYLGLLLMLPLLRKLVKNMSRKDFIYYIILHIILADLIPAAEDALSIFLHRPPLHLNPDFSPVLLTEQNIFCFIMGYFLENVLRPSEYTKRNSVLLGIAAAAAIALSMFLTHSYFVHMPENEPYTLAYFNYVVSFGAFFILKYSFAKRTPGPLFKKLIALGGSLSFGAYLLEELSKDLFRPVFLSMEPFIGSWWANIVFILFSLNTAFIASFLLKKLLRR